MSLMTASNLRIMRERYTGDATTTMERGPGRSCVPVLSRFAAEDPQLFGAREPAGGVVDFGVLVGGHGVHVVRAVFEAPARAAQEG